MPLRGSCYVGVCYVMYVGICYIIQDLKNGKDCKFSATVLIAQLFGLCESMNEGLSLIPCFTESLG